MLIEDVITTGFTLEAFVETFETFFKVYTSNRKVALLPI